MGEPVTGFILLLTLGASVPSAGGDGAAPEPAVTRTAAESQAVFRFILDDGSWVEGTGPVEDRGGLLLFRLFDGRPASLPAERLTDVVLVTPPVPASAPGESHSDVGEGHRRARPAPGESRAAISNADLPPPLPSSGPSSDGEAPTVFPPLTYEGYRDLAGRDEAWWRAAFAGIDDRIAAAEAEVEEAGAVLRAWRNLFLRDPGIPSIPIGHEITEARRRLELAQETVARLKAEREALLEEARVSDALPGWLR